jgi:hypothetical protein
LRDRRVGALLIEIERRKSRNWDEPDDREGNYRAVLMVSLAVENGLLIEKMAAGDG